MLLREKCFRKSGAASLVNAAKSGTLQDSLLRLLILFLSLSFTNEVGVGYGKVVPIPAGDRVQYQLLNHDGKGTYKFGYDTGTGPSQSFREEERDINGVVRGRYGFINPLGALKIVEYLADDTGFHIIGVQKLEPEIKIEEKVTTTEPPPPPEVTTTRAFRRPLPPFVGPLPPFVPRPPVTNIVT